MWKRSGDLVLLFDLERDPDELHDVAAAHPDILSAHRSLMHELASALAVGAGAVPQLGEDDIQRLRALGYLEDQ